MSMFVLYLYHYMAMFFPRKKKKKAINYCLVSFLGHANG